MLTCAACGSRPTEPLRLLPEAPIRPECDGRADPDGFRPAPPTVARGSWSVDPEPCGAPHAPHPDPERCDAANSGNSCMGDPDGEGFPTFAGPHGTLVTHPEDSRAYLTGNPAPAEIGCCGPPGREGPNELCAGCGAVRATLYAGCACAHETGFLPEAVRVIAV